MTADELRAHPFSKTLLNAARPLVAAEHAFEQEHPGGEWVPDELEFYVLRAADRWALLLSHCEQLSHGLLFFSTYRHTAPATRGGASRHKYLRYMIENYIVRTQTLYDLVLKLVDAVFHLTNADRQCRHDTIVRNLKVARTELPAALKRLQKKVKEFGEARNMVVHQGGFQEPDLYRLELFAELEEDFARSGEEIPARFAFVPDARQEMSRDLIRNRKRKYSRFNSAVFELLSLLFDQLLEVFEKEAHGLGLVIEKEY